MSGNLLEKKRSVWPVYMAAFGLILFGTLVYSNSFGVPFLFDDLANIVHSPAIKSLENIRDILATAPGEPVGGRPLVNLSFVIYLSKKIGISTHLDPVLSFPLGPNAISIMEAALAYEALLTGKTCLLGDGGGTAMVPIIKKIVDRDGKTLWEYTPEPKVVLPERVTILTSEILRKVMERGTGKNARDVVHIFDIPLPSFGKTGTANRFTNSSFVGLIPGPDNVTGQLSIDNGYTVASYVGFDNNQPMKGDHMALYGSSGALPLWMDTVRAIAKTDDFKNMLQPADLAFNPLLRPETPGKYALHPVPVSTVTGLPLKNGEKPLHPSTVSEVLTQAEDKGKIRQLKREFEPQ